MTRTERNLVCNELVRMRMEWRADGSPVDSDVARVMQSGATEVMRVLNDAYCGPVLYGDGIKYEPKSLEWYEDELRRLAQYIAEANKGKSEKADVTVAFDNMVAGMCVECAELVAGLRLGDGDGDEGQDKD